MGWDVSGVPNPQDPETFTRSKLDWAEPSAGDHARLLQLYRELVAAGHGDEDISAVFRLKSALFPARGAGPDV